MKKLIKILALTLSILMLLPLIASCKDDSTTSFYPEGDSEAQNDVEMKIYVLNGTTALGMAQMISKSKEEGAYTNDYDISLHTSAEQITGSIISGECAIAALPTNVAVRLFNRSEGKVQLLAINTLGVLYLLQNGESITSLSDLSGKTVYVPGEGANPEYITRALIESAGVANVTVDATTYTSPDELQAAAIRGDAKLVVLPEPKVTATISQNSSVTVALDLTTEWEAINGENTLVQGCLVVNSNFAKEHPNQVKSFLDDYNASVDFIKAGSEEAITMIVGAGILPKAQMAQKALPNCNICFIAGEDMKGIMNTFCQKIFNLTPQSIGGAMPTDDFYYIAQ